MFDTDTEMISYALDLWANSIETGNQSLSRQDVMDMKNSLDHKILCKYMKNLTPEQTQIVERIRALARRKYAIV